MRYLAAVIFARVMWYTQKTFKNAAIVIGIMIIKQWIQNDDVG